MSQDLTVAIIAGLGGMLGWGLADLFAKKSIDRIGDVTTLFWSLLIGCVPLTVILAFNPPSGTITASGSEIGYLVLLGIWSALSYLPLYAGFGKGKITLLSPIFASYAAVVVLLSAFFFGETLSEDRIAILILIFVGIILISGDLKGFWGVLRGREPIGGLKEILLAIALYSPWLIALDRFIEGKYWVPYLLAIRFISAVSIFAYTRVRNISLSIPEVSLWKYLCGIGIADVTAFAFLSWGYSTSNAVSIVTMLSAAFSLPTIILAYLFLKERVTKIQIFGCLVVIGGAMLLALV